MLAQEHNKVLELEHSKVRVQEQEHNMVLVQRKQVLEHSKVQVQERVHSMVLVQVLEHSKVQELVLGSMKVLGRSSRIRHEHAFC